MTTKAALVALCLPGMAQAVTCRDDIFEDASYSVCEVAPGEDLRLFLAVARARSFVGAARAMGFKLPQIYWNVLLPQAYRIIIPPLTSEFLNVFKNSSVASLIGLMELLAQTKQTAEFSANLFEAFTLATLIYFTLNMSLMLLMRLVEKKVAVPGLISVGGK